MRVSSLLIALLAGSSSLLAAPPTKRVESLKPWFTGPLLAPDGHTVARGHTKYQPYLFVTSNEGTFNRKWIHKVGPRSTRITPTMTLTQGIYHFVDLQFIVPVEINTNRGKTSTRLGDMGAILGVQVFEDRRNRAMPDVRLTLGMGFPTGQYRKLNPHKNNTDSSGNGTWDTSASLNVQKLWQVQDINFFRLRASLTYAFGTKIRVLGFNSYGGGYGCDGTIKPGGVGIGIVAFEYQFKQNWVFACDFMGSYKNEDAFFGNSGIKEDGLGSRVGIGKAYQLSMAPALEYNFSENVGIIAGIWYTMAGRNSQDFVSGVISVKYYK